MHQPDGDGFCSCSAVLNNRVKHELTNNAVYPDRSAVSNLENIGWA